MVLFAAILVLGLLISNISANELEVILEDADHDLIEDVIVFDGPGVVTASRPQISSSLTHPGTVPQLLPNFTRPKLPNPETVFFRIRLSSSLHHLMSKGATPKRKLEDLTTSSAAILSRN